jgi:hypothetical protein
LVRLDVKRPTVMKLFKQLKFLLKRFRFIGKFWY